MCDRNCDGFESHTSHYFAFFVSVIFYIQGSSFLCVNRSEIKEDSCVGLWSMAHVTSDAF